MPATVPAKSKAKTPKAKKPTKAEIATVRESARDKKARQRQAKRDAGLVEISVWVAPDHADALRDFAASLPAPTRETVPSGPSLFDALEDRHG